MPQRGSGGCRGALPICCPPMNVYLNAGTNVSLVTALSGGNLNISISCAGGGGGGNGTTGSIYTPGMTVGPIVTGYPALNLVAGSNVTLNWSV